MWQQKLLLFVLFLCFASWLYAIDEVSSSPLIILGDKVSVEHSADQFLSVSEGRVATWEVEVNPVMLAGDGGEELYSLSIMAGEIFPRITGQEIKLDLPGGREGLSLTVETLHGHDSGAVSYAGFIEDQAAWLFSLTASDSGVWGRFFMDDRLFLLHNTDEGRHLIHEIDLTRTPRQADDIHPNHDDKSLGLRQALSCSSYTPNNLNGNVRVLFLYTPDHPYAGSIGLQVDEIVALFNQSLWNSGVDFKNIITLAGVKQLPSNLSGRCWGNQFVYSNSIMGMMRDGAGPFSGLSQWMSQYYADIALLITSEDSNANTGGGCFIYNGQNYGRLGGNAFVFNPQRPYAGTTANYSMGDLTSFHEIGHVLGGLHESGGSGPGDLGTPDCGRGYVYNSLNSKFMTIMGGYADCPFDVNDGPFDQSCTRIPLWSNPDTTWLGQPTGNASDRWVARGLDITMTEVAGWKNHPDPKPTAAPSASIVPWGCCSNRLVWSSVSGAYHYQVISSFYANMDFPSIRYQGINQPVNVYSSDGYFRVRACNGNGCGPYSNIVSLN